MKVTKRDGTILFGYDFDLSLEEPSWWKQIDLDDLSLENKKEFWEFIHNPITDKIFESQEIIIEYPFRRRRDLEEYILTEEGNKGQEEWRTQKKEILKERNINEPPTFGSKMGNNI